MQRQIECTWVRVREQINKCLKSRWHRSRVRTDVLCTFVHTIWYGSMIQIYWDWDCGGMCVAKLQLSDAQQCIGGSRGPNVFLNAWDQLRHTRTWSVGRSVARVGAGRLPFCGGISAEPGLTGSGMFGIHPVVLKLASIARCRSLSLT